MPWLGWIEDNLLVLGLASVVAGFVIGMLCSSIQGRRPKLTIETGAVLRPTAMAKPSSPATARARPMEREPGRLVPVAPVQRVRAGGPPISRIGPAQRARTPRHRV
ncbi:MAG TPA: hypothetical protein VIA61_04420 [Methylomirabilota bacterium]|jgi:hypothetical protein